MYAVSFTDGKAPWSTVVRAFQGPHNAPGRRPIGGGEGRGQVVPGKRTASLPTFVIRLASGRDESRRDEVG